MTRYHQSLRTCHFPCPTNYPTSSLTLSLSSPHLTPPCNSPLGPTSKGSFSHPLGCDFRPREMNRKSMLPAKGVPVNSPSPYPNPSPNPFVYPHEKTLIGYDDFHVMPGPGARQEEEDDDGLLSRIFSEHRLATEGNGGEPVEAAEDADGVTEGTRGEEKRGRTMRKRTSGKTDRHSKIRTAQGLRDRRIRLSVQVSRKFFDLQDMLGFDKASNTIEWLITKSRGAIKGLSLRRGGASSKGVPEEISKCDVPSFEEFDPVAGEAVAGISKGKSSGESSRGGNKRDSRERARVRAKERTREKPMGEISKFSICNENPNYSPNFSATDGGRNFGSIEVIEKFLGITSASEPSLHADPTGSYYSENANYSGDERFQDARHLRGYYP